MQKVPSYKKHQPVKKNSLLFWLMMIFTLYFLIKAPFDTALFNGYTIQYEGPLYSFLVLFGIAMVILCIHHFFDYSLAQAKDFLSLFVWLIPLTFLISSFQAASPHYAKGMMYLHIMYAGIFIIGIQLARQKIGAQTIQLAITISGYIVVFYGFLNMFGNTYFKDAVMLDQGFRLTSVFQYANAYAAFLMAIMLCCLHYISTSRKWYYSSLHAFMLVPIVISFWLTLSRGALVVLPVILLLTLPFMKISRQVMWILFLIISLPLSFLIMDKITQLSITIFNEVTAPLATTGKPATIGLSDSRSLAGWGFLLVASTAGALLVTGLKLWFEPLIEKWLSKVSMKKFSPFVLPLAGVVAGIVVVFLLFGNTGFAKLFPETLQKRIESINFQQHSVLERGTFYKDSLKLVKDYPILGSGGGGWAALYEKYQNNPYSSRQAHSFFMQYLVEVGVVGFIVLLAFLMLVFYYFIKKHFSLEKDQSNTHLVYFFVSISLLVHSLIDFEMSYAFLAGLVFLCLGGMASVADQPVSWLKKFEEKSYVKYAHIGTLSAITIIFLIMSSIMVSANRTYASATSASQQQQSLEDVLESVDKALKLQPNHPFYLLARAELLAQAYSQSKNEQFYQKWKSTVEQAKQKEPNNRQIIDSEYNLLLVKGQYEEAVKFLHDVIQQYPWDITLYERAIGVNVESWNMARQDKKTAAMEQYDKTVYDLYHTIIAKTKELELLPKGQMQGREFYVTPVISFNIGQMEFIKGNIKEAADFFRPSAASAQIDQPLQPQELEKQKQYIRWYLAALKKLGQNDQALYDKLLAKFPTEQQEIDKLARANFGTVNKQ